MILYWNANLERWSYSELGIFRLLPSADKIAAYSNVNKFMFRLNIGTPWWLAHHGKPIITTFWGLRILFGEFKKRYLLVITWNSDRWNRCRIGSRDRARLSGGHCRQEPLGPPRHGSQQRHRVATCRENIRVTPQLPCPGAGTQSQASDNSWALHLHFILPRLSPFQFLSQWLHIIPQYQGLSKLSFQYPVPSS